MKARVVKCINQLKKVYGLQCEFKKNLKYMNSFKIDGEAVIFVQPKSLEHFIRCFHIFNENNMPFYCIGNATNLLVPPKFNGAVVRIADKFSSIKVVENTIVASAGALLNKVVVEACRRGFKGMEDGFGIPGTIGGAIFMNASAYNFRISDYVTGVLAMVDGKIREFSKEECEFGYRTSIFQKLINPIILEVNLTFNEKDESSKLLKSTIKQLEKRKETQPLNALTAGSVFKNPEGLSVAKLIDELNLKGYSIGGARISPKHANFIENYNNARFDDIVGLIKFVKQKVFEKHNLELEVEIQVLGESNDFWRLSRS